MPAAPIAAAIAGWMGVTSAIGIALIEIGVGLAISALARAIMPKPDRPDNPGIRTDVTLQGGTIPRTMIVGNYATGGTFVAPFYSTGRSGDTPNAFRYYIISLADHPINAITAIWINDTKFANPSQFDGDIMTGARRPLESAHPKWYKKESLYVRAYNGKQTAADPTLVDRYGTHSERPWTAKHIGKGVAYLWVAIRLDSELSQGEAQIKIEMQGSPLYDRRSDGTNGGTGTQREADRNTHVFTANPITVVENVMRGITLYDGRKWGLGVDWADLPVNNWNSQKGVCDVSVPSGTGNRPRYRMGYEIRMATADAGGDEPFDIIEQALKACSGQIVDVGGTFYVRAGPPSVFSFAFNDDDIVVDKSQEWVEHNGIKNLYNAIRATYPNPKQQWKPTEADIRSNAAWQAEDGEMLLADITINAANDIRQVRQLQAEYIKDSRRTRAHTVTLPPKFSGVIPLNVGRWNSVKHGYVTKDFECHEVAIDPITLSATLSIREIDPNDYNPEDFVDPGGPSDNPIVVDPGPLPGFGAVGVTVTDANGAARRPGIKYTWPTAYSGAERIMVETRIASNSAEGPDFTITNLEKLSAIQTAGLIGGQTYQVRARSNRSRWTAPITVTVPNVKLGPDDVDVDAGGDGLPPTAPTGITVTGGVRSLWVKWNNNPEPDLIRYEIHHRQDTALPANPAVHLTAGAENNFTGIAADVNTPPQAFTDNQTRYVWVRAVDSDGTSAWAGPYSGTTLPKLGITSALLQGMIDATSFATGLNPVQILTGAAGTTLPNPTTRRNSDLVIYNGDTYRWNGTTYTKSVRAAEIIDKLVSGQIEAGAITATQLAAGAIAAKHVSVFDFENRQPIFSFTEDSNDAFTVGFGTHGVFAGGQTGGFAMALNKTSAANAGAADIYSKPEYFFAVEPGQNYWVDTDFREGNGVARTGAFNFGLSFYTAAKAFISVGTNDIDAANQDGPFNVSTTWTRKTKQITVPANAKFATCYGAIPTGLPSGTAIHIDRIVARRANAAELLVDGTVHANKLMVETLAAKLALIGEAYINRAHIIDGEIVRAKIGLAAIDNARIAVAAIATANIQDLAVNSFKIKGFVLYFKQYRHWWANPNIGAFFYQGGYKLTGSNGVVTLDAFAVPRIVGGQTSVVFEAQVSGWGSDAPVEVWLDRQLPNGTWVRCDSGIVRAGYQGSPLNTALLFVDRDGSGNPPGRGRTSYRLRAQKRNMPGHNYDGLISASSYIIEHFRQNA